MTKGNDATGRPKGHCYDTPSTWGHDVPLHAILLKVTTGGVKWYNWLGHRWGSNPGRLKIKFDVNAVSGWNGDREASLVRDMVHEIGKRSTRHDFDGSLIDIQGTSWYVDDQHEASELIHRLLTWAIIL